MLPTGATKVLLDVLKSPIKTIVEYVTNAIGSGGRAATNRALKPNIGIPYAERSDVTRESNVAATTWKGSGIRNSSPLWKHAISCTVHWTTHHEVQDPSSGPKSDCWQMRYSGNVKNNIKPCKR